MVKFVKYLRKPFLQSTAVQLQYILRELKDPERNLKFDQFLSRFCLQVRIFKTPLCRQ